MFMPLDWYNSKSLMSTKNLTPLTKNLEPPTKNLTRLGYLNQPLYQTYSKKQGPQQRSQQKQ